jgi:hypothetical protein
MFVKSEKRNPSGPRPSATKCPCVTPRLAVVGGMSVARVGEKKASVLRSALSEAAPLSELTVASVRSTWPRATSAPPLPVLAHLAAPSAPPSPSRACCPKPSVLELQRHSADFLDPEHLGVHTNSGLNPSNGPSPVIPLRPIVPPW